MLKHKHKLHNARILIATFMLAAATGNVMEDADTAQHRPRLHNGQLVRISELPAVETVVARPRLTLTGQKIGGVASLPDLSARNVARDSGVPAIQTPGEPAAPQFAGLGMAVSVPAPSGN